MRRPQRSSTGLTRGAAGSRVPICHVVTERDVIDALERLDPVWDELFPAEQTRIVQLLVERVEVQPEGIELRLRSEGLRSLVAEISCETESAEKGARAG